MKRLPLLTVLLLLACGHDSPTESTSCSAVAGSYRAAGANSCGGSYSGQPVTISQSGCSFTGAIPGGSLTGTILSSTSATFTLVIAPPCGGTVSGTATFSSLAVNGTYTGTVTSSGPGCCPLGPISGSFTLTR